jgi:transposase
MTATHRTDPTTSAAPVLYLALELGWNSWKLAFTTGLGQSPRLRTVPARELGSLAAEIAKAKARFGLPADATVSTCYEAGRDGFWLQRHLSSCGIACTVVDSASIEVNRRRRRAKSDRLDAAKLVTMLIRWHLGDSRVWSTVRIPTPEAEDARQAHRELIELKAERTAHSNRIKGLLAGLGLSIVVDAELPGRLERLRQLDGSAVPPRASERILREFDRWRLVDRQVRDLDNRRVREVRKPGEPALEKVRRLMRLRGIGSNGAWILVHEFFGWREFRNRREVGALAGLVPTPYSSGDSEREQGISKAGNRRVRWLMIELAWLWQRYQPDSALSRWYQGRFGGGNSRQRRIGIVALARKLLIALWRYVEFGELPEGAVEVELEVKLDPRLRTAS